MPWTTWDELKTAIETQFSAVDKERAAMIALDKLFRKPTEGRSVQEYVADVDAIFERTKLGDVDKRERFRQGLPSYIKRLLFNVPTADIDSYAKLKTKSLKLYQQNEQLNQEAPRGNYFRGNFRGRGGYNRVAASQEINAAGPSRPMRDGPKCYNCNCVGHMAQDCRSNCGNCSKPGHISRDCRAP